MYATTNSTLQQDLRGISAASSRVCNSNDSVLADGKYNDLMSNYAISVRYHINNINSISESNMLYGKYTLANFSNFILEVVDEKPKNLSERKHCIDTIEKIAQELDSISDLGINYNFISDSRDVTSKVQAIEGICREWE